MIRRQVNPSGRSAESSVLPLVASLRSKSRSSSCLTIGVTVLGMLLLIRFLFSGPGDVGGGKLADSRVEGGFPCTTEVQRVLPTLARAYDGSMLKVLHVGPDTCSVVSKLLKEEGTEAWGVEPYDIEDADRSCRSLLRKGIVRVANIKFPLPYRSKSFSLVLVSDALDYLSPKYLNITLLELTRVSDDGLVMFTGYPGQQHATVADISKFGRPAKLRSASWWKRFFVQTGFEENEVARKRYEMEAQKRSYAPSCQVFHLKPHH